ncbi:hypothetical protein [Brevundimonas viscosa]|uniref:Uncharacterized protein n=1 Tax=Brevundimonas viscosa TaxID=871741 RepID=A0A1I6STK0_9CAUL|nr:hypothetical protein [Brevundimonas viscosa]SFS80250.1 hypothetical protein SAMN05192570_2660 [Brevundimonas viscosa]
MVFAAWLVAAVILLVFFGTWALQIALWLLMLALRLAAWTGMVLFGLVSLLALALIDRRQLARIWRNECAHAAAEAVVRRERWS